VGRRVRFAPDGGRWKTNESMTGSAALSRRRNLTDSVSLRAHLASLTTADVGGSETARLVLAARQTRCLSAFDA
jgi:hypothetical protein